MTKIEAFETGRVAEIPSSWDEMTAGQICLVFQMFDECVRSGKSPLEFNVRVLYYLLGLEVSAREVAEAGWGDGVSARDENVAMLCDKCLGFMFDGDSGRFSFDSVKNPLPEVRVGWIRLTGPADMLGNLTFGEFRHASAALNSFFSSEDVSDLDECLAFLYRRPTRKANRAGRFVLQAGADIDEDVKLVAGMEPWQKNLIVMWFSACLKYLQEGMVGIDGETVDMRVLFSGGEEAAGPSFGWYDLLVEIAKEQSLGTMEQVEEQPLYAVLGIMWHNYKEKQRYEQNVKNSKA